MERVGRSVDWRALEATLREIPEEMKHHDEETFDPTPFAADVLNSQSPGEALQGLKERRRVLDEITKDVSIAKTSQFNQSLSSYREALSTLNDCTSRVEEVEQKLRDSESKLKPQTDHLEAQWMHKLVLEQEVPLLSRISALASAPREAEQLSDEGFPKEAVDVLMDAMSFPDDAGEITTVRTLQKDLESSFQQLKRKLLSRLHETLFPGSTRVHKGNNRFRRRRRRRSSTHVPPSSSSQAADGVHEHGVAIWLNSLRTKFGLRSPFSSRP